VAELVLVIFAQPRLLAAPTDHLEDARFRHARLAAHLKKD